MKTKKILSAYTVAALCSDMTDVKFGIDEIREAIAYCNKHNKPVPSYFYSRLHKLEGKMRKLGGIVEMPGIEFKGSDGTWWYEHDHDNGVYRVHTLYGETICQLLPLSGEAEDPARVSANFQAIAAVPQMLSLLQELYVQLETHRPRFYKREYYLRLRKLFDSIQ